MTWLLDYVANFRLRQPNVTVTNIRRYGNFWKKIFPLLFA
jgi:hypothetical protein